MDAIKIERLDLMMYLVDKKFNRDKQCGRSFSKELLKYDAERANEIFSNTHKFHYPILECICCLKYDLGYDDPVDLTKMVTQALRDSGNAGFIDVYSEKVLNDILQSLDAKHAVINFEDRKLRNLVYERLAKKLTKDSRLFAHFLLPHDNVKNVFWDKCDNVEDCALETFKIWDRITEPKLRTWKSIRQILIILNKPGYIKSIEKEFGGNGKGKQSIYESDKRFDQCSENLKRFYQGKFKYWIQANSFKEKGMSYVKKDRRDIYIPLMMGGWLNAHENDKEYFLRSMYQQNEPIEMHQLVDKDDKLIILRGIAGIGKTSFVDSLVLNWANGDIYQEFDFIVKLSCRELNVLNNINSLEDLLNRQCPGKLGDYLHNFSNKKILIILDGIDEFRYLQDVINASQGNPSDNPLASVVYQLINPNSYLLSNKTVVLCGRPKASEDIYNCFRVNAIPKLVEITGFNEESVRMFIEQHFAEDKKQGEVMKQRLKGKDYLQAMVRIPIYAYILCNVFQSGALIEELNTTTKLNIACCLVFLRDHMRREEGQPVSLKKMCEDETIIQTIRELSKFAYRSLEEQRIIFDADDFCNSKYLSSLEASGIFEKHGGDENGDIYQFKHLVLQEFLCAVHMLAEGSIFYKEYLTNSAEMFVGLHGLLQDKSKAPKYLKAFAAAIAGRNRDKSIESAEKLLLRFYCDGEKGYLSIRFLTSIYEYHCSLSDSLEEYFLGKSVKFTISCHHELQQFIYFLKNIKIITVDAVRIHLSKGHISLADIEGLVPYLPTINIVELGYFQPKFFQRLSEELIKVNKEKSVALKLIDCEDGSIIKLSKSIPGLEALDLSCNNNMTSKGFHEMSQCLCDAYHDNNNYLKQLKLRDCDLNDDHITALSKSIPYLESLNLSFNTNITSKGFRKMSQHLCDAYKNNKYCLKHLDLSHCKLDDDSIIALSKWIPNLESVDLSNNQNITSKGYNEIISGLNAAYRRGQHSLKNLHVDGGNIDSLSQLANRLIVVKNT